MLLNNKFATRLKILITTRCNLFCRKCNHWKQVNKDFDNCLLNKIDISMDEIILTGGEPTTRKDLAQIIGILSHKGPITIYSNMYDLDKRKIEELKYYGLNKIVGWIDTDNEQDFLELTHADGFYRVLNNIKQTKENGVNFVLNTTISMLNVNKLRAILEIAKDYGVKYFTFNELVPQQDYDFGLKREDVKRVRETILEYLDFLKLSHIDSSASSKNIRYVHINGEVYWDINKRNVLGILHNQDFSATIDNYTRSLSSENNPV